MGRLPESGEVFYLGRVRVQGWHSEMLRQFLVQFCAVGQNEKLEMLEQLIKGGGFDPGCLLSAPEIGESTETANFMTDFLQ